MLSIHFIICLISARFHITVGYLVFLGITTGITVWISVFASRIMEQKKLRAEIMAIESEDRKVLAPSK